MEMKRISTCIVPHQRRLGAGIASYLSGCTTTSSATQRLQFSMPSQLKQVKLSAPSPLGSTSSHKEHGQIYSGPSAFHRQGETASLLPAESANHCASLDFRP